MKRPQSPTWPCAICGQPSALQAAFIPEESKQLAYGAPAGTTRIVCYGLCEQCAAKVPAIIPEIERRALAEIMGHTWN